MERCKPCSWRCWNIFWKPRNCFAHAKNNTTYASWVYFIVFNLSDGASGGNRIGINITANSSISFRGNSSALSITTGGTFPQESSVSTIIGNVTVAARNGVIGNVTVSTGDFIAANFTVNASGEKLNNITVRVNTTGTSVSSDLTQLLIFKDSACDGSISGDTLVVNDSTVSASETYLLAGQSIEKDSLSCYVVAYNISSGATAGDIFYVQIGSNAISATGNVSMKNLTS